MNQSKCEICGWPLRDKVEDGCTKESCSMRPCPKKEETGEAEKAVQAERERIIEILLRNEFCFANEVYCAGHSSENCEACVRKVIEL